MAAIKEPVTELDTRFSSEGATPTPWSKGNEYLEKAEIFWLSTVRPDGQPHVTPLLAVWLDGALSFCTGPGERKAKNIEQNTRCILTTGCNTFAEGLDLVIEGSALRVTDNAKLQRIADRFESKYGSDWRFTVRDGAFHHGSGSLREEDTDAAFVFEVAPVTAFGFGKGETFSQTRWRF